MTPDDPHPATDSRMEKRSAFLTEMGVGKDFLSDLLTYCEGMVADPSEIRNAEVQVDDETFVEAWAEYAKEAEAEGGWPVLCRHLVQFDFPVDVDTADSPDYAAATRRGVRPDHPAPPKVHKPDGISITLHESAAGRIPVITATDRQDFVTIVQTLLRKSNPEPIPESMGASMVAGYSNWDRIARYRENWTRANPLGDWSAEFRELAQKKDLYQDRFILLSSGDYSGVSSQDVGMEAEDWLSTSIALRREHESVHYFTRRVLGSMRNSLLDELIADAMATRRVTGTIQKDWLDLFFGIENWPAYREGGRLQNYVPDDLAPCFDALTGIMYLAIEQVARADQPGSPAASWPDHVFLLALCSCSLDELARPDGGEVLQAAGERFLPA